jgi:DNA mismatch repair protein MutL
VVDKAISRGYRERLMEGRQPVVFLFLEIPPETIDVNIHPNKKEIRFHDEKWITELIAEAIIKALSSVQALTGVTDGKKEYTKSSGTGSSRVAESPVRVMATGDDYRPEKTEQVDIKSILSNMRAEAEKSPGTEASVAEASAPTEPAAETPADNGNEALTQEERPVQKPQIAIETPANAPFDVSELHVTGNIFRTYITATDERAFYLIDQHAAQERVFYEQLVGEYLADDKPSQTILTPLVLDVPLEVKENEYDWLDSFRDMGYHIEEFGPSSYIIKEIPYFMEIGEAETFAKDFVDGVRDQDDLQNTVVINKLITTSCKRSVKAHDHLSEREMTDLLKQLAACRNPFSCPHGRPTIVRFSEYEIQKMFKRVQ